MYYNRIKKNKSDSPLHTVILHQKENEVNKSDSLLILENLINNRGEKMPSYKPKVQILLSEEYHKKFKALCEQERRSDSVMGAIMIEQFIDNYENEHGEIKTKTANDIIQDQIELMKNPNKKNKLGNSLKNGLALGNAIMDEVQKKK